MPSMTRDIHLGWSMHFVWVVWIPQKGRHAHLSTKYTPSPIFYGTVATLEYFGWENGNGNLRSDGKVDRWRTKLMYLICLGSLIYFPARIQSPTRQHQWRIRTASAFPIHSTRGIKITAYILRRLQTNLTSAPASWFSSPASLRRTWNIPTIRTTLPTHIWARSFSRARFTNSYPGLGIWKPYCLHFWIWRQISVLILDFLISFQDTIEFTLKHSMLESEFLSWFNWDRVWLNVKNKMFSSKQMSGKCPLVRTESQHP